MSVINAPNPKQPQAIVDAVGIFDEKNIFNADIKKPEWDPILKELSLRYTIADVLEKVGSAGTYTNGEIFWAEIGYFKKNQTVASATITTNTADVVITETERYFVVGDTISLSATGVQVQVKAIVDDSPQTITVETLDGSTLVSGDFVDCTLYHIGSFMAKCGTLPDGRYFAPTKQSAIETIQPTTADYCIDDVTQMVWIGDGYWYHKNQVLKRQEHKVVKQGNILWGNGNTTAITNGTSGAGLVPTIFQQGTVITDSTSVTEDNIIDFVAALRYNGADYSYNEYLCLCGYKYHTAVTIALKAYVVNSNGNSRYLKGSEGDFGLELQTYKLNGLVVTFVACAALDEPGVENLSGIPDTQNMGLYLNIGQNDQGRGVELLYKKLFNGIVENELMARKDGIGSVKNGGVVSQSKRCFSEYITSSYILKLTYRNSHGIHYLA